MQYIWNLNPFASLIANPKYLWRLDHVPLCEIKATDLQWNSCNLEHRWSHGDEIVKGAALIKGGPKWTPGAYTVASGKRLSRWVTISHQFLVLITKPFVGNIDLMLLHVHIITVKNSYRLGKVTMTTLISHFNYLCAFDCTRDPMVGVQ